MFAINHAAAALIFKKRFPEIKMIWLLLSVQLVEFLWVIFNYTGIEKTTTETNVTYVGDIHLSVLSFSHSLLSTIILSLTAYLVLKYLAKNNQFAIAISLAIASHFILDVITHACDLPISFIGIKTEIGSTLYTNFPYAALALEFAFGIFCWWYYKGSKSLLYIIVLFNLSNFTLFSPDIIGIEKYFSNKPILIVSVIAIQIFITLLLVGYFSKKRVV